MNMNLRSLAAFRAVMEHGTVTEAAEHLHITQPAMSRLISGLERELDIKLFHRRRKRLLPSAEGEAFYREAQRILAAVEEIPRLAQDIRAHAGARLRVVAMPRFAASLVVPALERFTAAFPRIHHTVEVLSRVDMERWVSRRQFDIGVGALPAVDGALQTEELFRVPAVAVLALNHPLARRRSINAHELADEPLIMPATGTMIRHQMTEILERAGVVPQIRTESGSSVLACRLARAGVGITISDALTPRSFVGRDVALVPIEPRYEMAFGTLTPATREAEAATTAFARILKDVVRESLAAAGLGAGITTSRS